MEILEKCVLWYAIHETGDRCSDLVWFLSEKEALEYKSDESEYVLARPKSIETFINSDVYKKAMCNKIERDAHFVLCEFNEAYENSYGFGFLYNIDTKVLLINNYGIRFSNDEKKNIITLLKEKFLDFSDVVFEK